MDYYEFLTRILDLLSKNRGKVLGALIGLFVGILFLTIGLLKTVFILGCSMIGFIIGGKIDDHGDLRDLLNRIIPPRE